MWLVAPLLKHSDLKPKRDETTKHKAHRCYNIITTVLSLIAVLLDQLTQFHVVGDLGTYGLMRYSENELTASAPRTSLSSSGSLVTWKSSYKSAICSKYFSWTLWRAAQRSQGAEVLSSSWLTMMLCVSIPHRVNSWTRRSVSYSERNSAMQTQTKVVWLGSLNCAFTCLMTESISSILLLNMSELNSASPKSVATWLMNGATWEN